MTIKEVKEYYKGKYTDCEIYRWCDNRNKKVHTDYICETDDMINDIYNENEEVEFDSLMDEKEYDMTINANSGIKADFGEWYDDKNAKVLVIVLNEKDEEG